MLTKTDLGRIAFSPGGEEWIEFGPDTDRTRVGFHDYAALYAVPGLYERVFHEELGMCSAEVVIALWAHALGGSANRECVLDLGAGSGIGGELLRRDHGVGSVVGLDLEPAAAEAAARDRAGAYDDFHVADLATNPEVLAPKDFTSVLAISAIGKGHIPLALLADTIERVLRPGGLFAFAVAEELLPDFFEELFARVDAERLGERAYVHRRCTDGTPHRATAVVARLAG